MRSRPMILRWQVWFVVLALAAFTYEANQYIEHAAAWAERQGFASSTAQAPH